MNQLIKSFFILLVACTLVFAGDKDNMRTAVFIKSIDFETAKNYNKAIDEINKLYSKSQNDYLVNLRLGWLHYLNKDYDKSVRYYKAAIKLSNESIEAQLGITYPYSALEKWGEIKAIYLNILTVDAQNYTANLRLGQIHLNYGEYNKALKYLNKLIVNYPSDYETNLYLGWIYYYTKDNSKAESFFNNALIANPGDKYATEGLDKIR